MQNGGVLHGPGTGNHLRNLGDFWRNENRDIREKQSDKVIASGFMLPQLVLLHLA